MKKAVCLFLGVVGLVFSLVLSPAFAADETATGAPVAPSDSITIYLFHSESCPHCKVELQFLADWVKDDPRIKYNAFEVSQNKNNQKLLLAVQKKVNNYSAGVPYTVVGDKVVIGFDSADGLGAEIKRYAELCLVKGCSDPVGDLIASISGSSEEEKSASPEAGGKTVDLPFWGKIELKNFSLPAIAIMLGLADGFNPCAMWVLVFLISLLLGMQNRRRMWILGSVFILASGFVYFLFMTAWLNFFLFIGFVVLVRLLIGLVALIAGTMSLRKYLKNEEVVCVVSKDEKSRKIFDRLKQYVVHHNFFLALGGIIVLAFAVNLVELLCSLGLPAVFTQTLALSNLPEWHYYLYILVYLFCFMLDDMVIFVLAMVTLRVTGFNQKYTRFSALLGGLVMVGIGVWLVWQGIQAFL